MYSIERIISRFFDDPLDFRKLQARTSTIISGSSALQFFDRSFYPSSDLDLYAHRRYRREIGRWLLRQGYVFRPNKRQAPDFESAIVKLQTYYVGRGRIFGTVFTFTKSNRVDDTNLKVQIIVASKTPMHCILNFHSCEQYSLCTVPGCLC